MENYLGIMQALETWAFERFDDYPSSIKYETQYTSWSSSSTPLHCIQVDWFPEN
jgi:hypothetical protein